MQRINKDLLSCVDRHKWAKDLCSICPNHAITDQLSEPATMQTKEEEEEKKKKEEKKEEKKKEKRKKRRRNRRHVTEHDPVTKLYVIILSQMCIWSCQFFYILSCHESVHCNSCLEPVYRPVTKLYIIVLSQICTWSCQFFNCPATNNYVHYPVTNLCTVLSRICISSCHKTVCYCPVTNLYMVCEKCVYCHVTNNYVHCPVTNRCIVMSRICV